MLGKTSIQIVGPAIAGTMAGGEVHIVMAGNPTVPSGAFFDAFTKECGFWDCMTIDVFDSPNLQGLSLEQLLRMDPTEGGPLDHNPLPHLVTRRWVYEQYFQWWHGNKSSSPHWFSRVLARFPEQAQNALIKMAWLERARQCALQNPAGQSGSVPLVAGVDVGGGEAETVVYLCECGRDRRRIIAMGAWRGEDTRGEVVNFLNQFRSRLSQVRVDAIGIGHNFALHLRDCRFPVELINVALACESKPQLGGNDPAGRFANLKARFFQTLADAFERDQVEGLTDETTVGQLAGVLYEIDSQGRMKIESKEQARTRECPRPTVPTHSCWRSVSSRRLTNTALLAILRAGDPGIPEARILGPPGIRFLGLGKSPTTRTMISIGDPPRTAGMPSSDRGAREEAAAPGDPARKRCVAHVMRYSTIWALSL